MTTRSARSALAASSTLALLLSLSACSSSKGPAGPTGPAGTSTGTVSGTVVDAVAGGALAGVAVTISDTGGATLATAQTDGNGSFTASAPAGIVYVDLARQYYTSPGHLLVGVLAGKTVTVSASLSESALGWPSVTLAAPGDDVGYGATVPLVATASDPNGDALTFSWENVTSPALGAVSGSGANGTLTTPTMSAAFGWRADLANPGQFVSGYSVPDRFGIVPITADTRGQVTATVTVTDGRGGSGSASVTVSAASAVGDQRTVAIGTRLYLDSGHDAGNAWTLTTVPSGLSGSLSDPTARTPSLVLAQPGTYVASEGGNAVTVFAGTWLGVIAGGTGDAPTVDSTCLVCHTSGPAPIAEDEFTPWLGTGHATVFTRGIDGQLGPAYGAACIGCHAVGYDPGVASGGFDDLAAAQGWSFPSTLAAGNWADLVAGAPTVARMANVQCESCHGPQSSDAHMATDVFDPTLGNQHRPFVSPRISYSAEACGTCHAAGAYHIYSEWATASPPEVDGLVMAHSNRADALLATTASGLNSSCGRCHTAQGYTLYVSALAQGHVALDTNDARLKLQLKDVTPANAEPVTCVACHDPHDSTNPHQLRVYGSTPLLPSGFAAYGLGEGAICVTCHNSRNGAQNGSLALTYLHEDGETYNSGNPTGYSVPHQSTQGDVFAGHNAYFLGAASPMTSKHAAVEDGCVGCHMTLQPRTFLSGGTVKRSGHLFRILDEDQTTLCASCHGPSVDGGGIQGLVQAELAALASKLGKAAAAKIGGVGGVINVRAYDPATDLYSSTSASNLAIDLIQNPLISASPVDLHGQLGLALTFTSAVTIQLVDGNGNPSGAPQNMTTFSVQLGSLKDNQATPVALYTLSGNLIRAGWNYFLVAYDQSRGLHNPGFVQAVLTATLAKDLSN